jgi:hypothetical protein
MNREACAGNDVATGQDHVHKLVLAVIVVGGRIAHHEGFYIRTTPNGSLTSHDRGRELVA